MGRHLTEIPRLPEYVPGAPEATELGEPKPGAPEESRILSDFELLKDAAERGGAVDLQAQIPLVSPFIQHTAAPFAKNAFEAVKETAVGLARALQPRLMVEGRYLDEVSRALGTKNRALSEFRVSVAVRKMRSVLDKLPKQEQVDFIDRVKLGQRQPTPELQVVDDLIQKLEDGWYAMLQEEMELHGKSLPYLENHLALIYDKKNAASKIPGALEAVQAQMTSKRPFEGTKSFMRKMVYQSLSEAMQNGLTPVSTNPFVLMELRLQDNMKFLSARKMFRTLKDQGAVRFVPLGTERKFLSAQQGWRPIDDRISRVYFPTEAGQVHAGNYYWEPNTHRIISNYLSRDLIRETKVGRGLVAMKNYGTAIELGLSPFHFYFVNGDAMATGTSIGFRKLATGNFKGGLEDIVKGVAGSFGPGHLGLFGPSRDYVREGGSIVRYIGNKDEFLRSTRGQEFVKAHPNIDAEIDAMFEGGLLLKQNEDYRLHSIEALKESYANGDYAGMMIRAFPAAVQAPVQHLFETYIPQMKIGAFLADYGQSLIEHQDALARGTVSKTALARAAVDRVEDRFGEMNFDNLFWNRTMKTAFQLLMRSVTWNLGDIRAVSRAAAHGIPAQAREFNDAVFEPIMRGYKEGGLGGASRAPIRAPRLDADLTWLAGVVVHTAISSTIAQGVFTAMNSPDHKPLMPWESDTPLVDIAMPRTGLVDRSGRPLRLSIASYLREWVSYWKRPKQFIGHKLSATFARAMETWQNKDFYGNWVYDPEGPAWKKFVDIVGHQITSPISLQTIGSAERNYGMPGAQAKALPFFGLGISSPSYFATPFEEYMQNILHAEYERRPGRSPEEADRAELSRDVVQAIRQGKDVPEEALTLGSEKLSRAAREGLKEGFTARVDRLSLKQLLDGWEYASQEEKVKLQPILMRKVQNARLKGKSEAQVNEILRKLEEIQNEGGQ